MIELHRLLGLTLVDLFTNSPCRVELEKDLSRLQQFLDVVIIKLQMEGQIPELPDGLENLGCYNLLSYKSWHETLDSWVLDELFGHYVNYRKQESPSPDKLLPVDDFRFYALTTRRPDKLANEVLLTPIQQGVYEAVWGMHPVRIIVLSQVPEIPRNAIWQMFSGVMEKVQFGVANYQWRRRDHSTVINDLFQAYQVEGISMPYTFEDYYKDFTKRHLDWLTTEERLKGLSLEELRNRLPVEERLKGLPPEELRNRLPVEERLKGLSAKQIEAYLKKLSQKTRRRK
jgi:hypothetical protein